MKRTRFAAVLLGAAHAGLVASGCAPLPRPALLANADQVRKSPAVADASRLVPQAVARAERFRDLAEEAYGKGAFAASSILAERAIAAYEHAAVLARVVRAVSSAESVRQNLAQAQQDLVALDAEQAHLLADINAIEMRIKVIKDAEPIVASGKADPAREAARLEAARAIVMDARLLCVSARLVSEKATVELSQAEHDVQQLETALTGTPRPAPIDEARRARAACLSALTSVRRLSAQPASSGVADVVLAELSSKTGQAPFRDDRGVVIALPVETRGPDLDAKARRVLDTFTTVAQAHPEFPVLAVILTRARAGSVPAQTARARLQVIAKILADSGIRSERLHTELAEVPSSPASTPGLGEGERIELVLVSPGT